MSRQDASSKYYGYPLLIRAVWLYRPNLSPVIPVILQWDGLRFRSSPIPTESEDNLSNSLWPQGFIWKYSACHCGTAGVLVLNDLFRILAARYVRCQSVATLLKLALLAPWRCPSSKVPYPKCIIDMARLHHWHLGTAAQPIVGLIRRAIAATLPVLRMQMV